MASKGMFNTTFKNDVNYINEQIPGNYAISSNSGFGSYTSELLDYSLEINKRISFGTHLSAGMQLRAYGNDSLYQRMNSLTVNDAKTARGTLFFNIEQPLFKYRGDRYNLYQYNTATTAYRLSELSNYAQISLAVYQSLHAYLNSVYFKIF